jgi:hypothetical protein
MDHVLFLRGARDPARLDLVDIFAKAAPVLSLDYLWEIHQQRQGGGFGRRWPARFISSSARSCSLRPSEFLRRFTSMSTPKRAGSIASSASRSPASPGVPSIVHGLFGLGAVRAHDAAGHQQNDR